MYKCKIRAGHARRSANSVSSSIAKGRKTQILHRSGVGKNNPCYVKLNHVFLIQAYFNNTSIGKPVLARMHNQEFNTRITTNKLDTFYRILNFPFSRLSANKKIREDFVKDNTYRISWYCEVYERLEEEYYYNKHSEKHVDTFS